MAAEHNDRELGRVQFWIIVLVVVALVVPMVISYRRVYRNRTASLHVVHTGGQASPAVYDTFSNQRLASVVIGDAAREAVGGTIVSIRAPESLKDLAERESDHFQGERPALKHDYIRHAVGAPFAFDDAYEVALTRQEIAELREAAEFVEHPRDVIAVLGGTADEGITLYTDTGRHRIYVVPDSLRPER